MKAESGPSEHGPAVFAPRTARGPNGALPLLSPRTEFRPEPPWRPGPSAALTSSVGPVELGRISPKKLIVVVPPAPPVRSFGATTWFSFVGGALIVGAVGGYMLASAQLTTARDRSSSIAEAEQAIPATAAEAEWVRAKKEAKVAAEGELARVERERKAAAEAARVKAEQDAKTAAEAARIKSEEVKAAEAQRAQNLAALASPVQTAKSAAVSAGEIARQLQIELRRVGCFTSEVDGGWNANSRSAVELFNKHGHMNLEAKAASLDALDLVRSKTSRICPVTCPRGFHVEKERCVETICKAGFVIGDDGSCERTRERPARQARPEPKPAATSNEASAAKGSSSGMIACDAGGCRKLPAKCKLTTIADCL